MPGTRPSTIADTTEPGLPTAARAALLAWYDARGRALAFRESRDPYAILVSEVMAQQTQVSRVVPAWAAFLARFPTVRDLAGAAPADVLRAWKGMGYDRRALNLQRAARAILDRHGGRVPPELVDLERLPGVGPYTARAVASIAFGSPVAAVDTNVRRVLGRALGIVPDGSSAGARRFQASADRSVDALRPADWTHAVMDLGATICRPRSARCGECPIAAWCTSAGSPGRRANGTQRRPSSPFTTTSRWLRGRILDRLRSVDGDAWARVEGPIGDHDAAAVARALRALGRDGLVELAATDERSARLPVALSRP